MEHPSIQADSNHSFGIPLQNPVNMKIVIGNENTVLVSDNGTLKDSGVSIGDDEIGEPSQYANANTLATEKAVAKKVEDNVTHWSSF